MHLTRVSKENLNCIVFKPFRRRQIIMGLNVAVHGSEQLKIQKLYGDGGR